jgi:PAS domain S-box-containing protein
MGAPRLRRSPADLTLIGFIVAACVALALVAATQWLAWQQGRASEWALRGQEALGVIADTRAALVDIQNGHRGYTIEGTQESLRPYEQGTAAIVAHARRLRELLRDTPEQQTHLAEFERLLPSRLATAAQIVEARRTGGFEAASQVVATGGAAWEMALLRSVLDDMDRQQETIFRQRVDQQHATLTRLARWVGAVTFLLLPALGLLYVQIRRRRAMQQALVESEEQLRLTMESVVGYAIVMLDPDGRVKTWNAGAERILGYTRDQAHEHALASFYPPDQVQQGEPAADLDRAVRHGSHAVEGWRVRRDGSAFWATTVLNVIVAPDGEIRGYSMVLRDLTERRRIDAEKAHVAEQLRSLNETLEAQVALRTQELRASNEELERTKLRLQQLSARIVEHQEQERRRVAYELHEDMAQSMSAIRIDLVRAQRDADSGRPVTDALKLLDALIGQTRDMVARLRPTMLDDLGLPDALEGELAWHGKRHGWQTRLHVAPRDFPVLPPQVATACFRVAQEALSNAARHAHAQSVEVGLRMRGNGLELTVQDDGVGFDPQQLLAADTESESFGLAFMRERARQIDGRLEIGRASEGRGVRVRLLVPLAGEESVPHSGFAPSPSGRGVG